MEHEAGEVAALTCRSEEFSLPPDVHYFNCAYMGPLPRVAEQAGIEAIRQKAVPTRVGPGDFFSVSDALRERFARLVNGDAARVAIIPAVSYGMATVARNAALAAGQRVVIAGGQFPSNVYPWRRLAAERNARVHVVDAPSSTGRGAAWNEALLDAIDAATGIVALPHVHWTDGTRFDLEAIGRKARAVGALLVVDGTQSVGALPFDVQRVRPDALVCAGYKWMLGPYSIGLACYGERFDDGVPLEETWISRENSEDFQALVNYRDEYRPGAARFDVGERSNFILAPMLLAALECVERWSPAGIQNYCDALLQPVLEEAVSLGCTVEDRRWRGAHLVGVRIPADRELQVLARALRSRGVHASLRGGALRLAPHLYNDDADVAALLDALRSGLGRGAASGPGLAAGPVVETIGHEEP
jgi:selenocysteine lyase/cysteine desulfurase